MGGACHAATPVTALRAAGLLALVPSVLPAQEPAPQPAVGARVRLESSAIVGRQARGVLRDVNQGFVTLALGARGSTLTVPWSRITTMSVSAGRDRWAGVTVGALVGAGASLVLAPAVRSGSDTSSTSRAVASFVALPLVGGVLGRWSGPERWEAVSWRPSRDTVLPEGEQPRLRLAADSRLLVRAKGRWTSGDLLSDAGDSLALRTRGGPVRLAWQDIVQVSARAGRSRARGAAAGLTIMGAFSIVELFAGPARSGSRKQRMIGRNLVIGAAGGALIGRASWVRVPLPVR